MVSIYLRRSMIKWKFLYILYLKRTVMEEVSIYLRRSMMKRVPISSGTVAGFSSAMFKFNS
jgi:hypothetical protein